MRPRSPHGMSGPAGEPLVTVVIPVYREPERLACLLDTLLAPGWPPREILVPVDEPDGDMEALIQAYEERGVRFIVSRERRGKVAALNDAVSRARGRLIVFLDNDVQVDKGFLKTVVEAMEGSDVGEIKKVARGRSLLARMVNYDYLSFGVSCYLFYSRLRRCAGLNGAAFAMTLDALKELGGFKRCVLEDLDAGYRSYFHGLRFRYIYETEAVVDPPRSWGEWLEQRKRWVIGTALWAKEYFFQLRKSAKKNKLLSLAALLVLFPATLFPWIIIFSSLRPVESLALIALYFLTGYVGAFFPITLLLSYSLSFLILRTLAALTGYFAVYAAATWYYARKIRFPVNPFWLAVYFFFYAPLWYTLLVAGFIRVIVFKKRDVKGWKI